jgi:predicted Zn-dependent protease
MKHYFYALVDKTISELADNEILTMYLSGEQTDFCRFNHAKIRQHGHVQQAFLSLRLICDGRKTIAHLPLTQRREEDERALRSHLVNLREQVKLLPEDPHLIYSRVETSSEFFGKEDTISSHKIIEDVCLGAKALDFVGLLASGQIFNGYADSFGQKNWFETNSYNLDWSLYLEKDKAYKDCLAGFKWDTDAFHAKISGSAQALAVLKKAPITISPGKYRVFLAPSAVSELCELLGNGGFSMQAHQAHFSPLTKMTQGEKQLNEKISISENFSSGLAANFNEDGFMRPNSLALIEHGKIKNYLVSPRTSKEYGTATNGASERESAVALDMQGGVLKQSQILSELGEGLYVSNLHYLNYSDRVNGRITGMTRFATFWVEDGKIKAPLNVMRFDDSIYNILGQNLEELTQEREFVFSTTTYFERSRDTQHLPGALVRDFCFTL